MSNHTNQHKARHLDESCSPKYSCRQRNPGLSAYTNGRTKLSDAALSRVPLYHFVPNCTTAGLFSGREQSLIVIWLLCGKCRLREVQKLYVHSIVNVFITAAVVWEIEVGLVFVRLIVCCLCDRMNSVDIESHGKAMELKWLFDSQNAGENSLL